MTRGIPSHYSILHYRIPVSALEIRSRNTRKLEISIPIIFTFNFHNPYRSYSEFEIKLQSTHTNPSIDLDLFHPIVKTYSK